MRPITKSSDFAPSKETTVSDVGTKSALEQKKPPIVPKKGDKFDTDKLLLYLVKMTTNNKGAKKWANVDKLDAKAVKYLYGTVFSKHVNNYGLAKKPLINDLGQFCSYCEIRVNDTSLAVEHKLPKSQFPGEMLAYNNFLLACFSCNSSNKGAKPTYAQGMEWSKKKVPTYDEVIKAADDHYWWPEDNSIEIYQSFIQELRNSFSIPYNIFDATYPANKINKVEDGLVHATIGKDEVDDDNITVDIYSNDARAKEMIKLVGMDKYVDQKLSDRRMLARTMAWFYAVQSYALNNQVAQLPDDTPGKDALVKLAFEQLLSVAAESGFYTVWVKILNYLSPAKKDSIYEKFKTSTVNDNIYFPGTDENLLPV